MKQSLILFLILIITGCSQKPETMLTHLNGYWEIEKAEMHDGLTKDYGFNASIDYLMVNDSLKGFRKKLIPNIDGSFIMSKDAEALNIVIENDSLHIYYSTPFNTWKETVLMADKKQLKIINSQKDVYLYKRYQPLNLDL